MPRPSEREIEASYERAGYAFDADDDLLRHVMLDDAPRQGLHQHGDAVKTCDKLWHRDQPLPCQLCVIEEEDANMPGALA